MKKKSYIKFNLQLLFGDHVRPIIIFLAIFLVLQFFPGKRTNPPATAEIRAPREVMNILKKSCYNCHSNLTEWPLYSKVAPFSWLIVKHVNDGRKELNFSEWRKNKRTLRKNLQNKIWQEIEAAKMPLPMYTFIHASATLTLNEKVILKRWTMGK